MPLRVLEGDFAGWLRDEMKSRRITARMLAHRAGVDHTTIYRLTIGERQPSLATAVAIIRVLTVQPSRGPFYDELSQHADAELEEEAG